MTQEPKRSDDSRAWESGVESPGDWMTQSLGLRSWKPRRSDDSGAWDSGIGSQEIRRLESLKLKSQEFRRSNDSEAKEVEEQSQPGIGSKKIGSWAG